MTLLTLEAAEDFSPAAAPLLCCWTSFLSLTRRFSIFSSSSRNTYNSLKVILRISGDFSFLKYTKNYYEAIF